MKLKSFFAVVLILLSSTVYAQDSKQTIQFLDAETASPISQASFIYGNQKGISDEQGFVHFTYQKGRRLSLSHLNYGKWELDDAEVLEAIQRTVYYRYAEVKSLYPVTVIGLRKEFDQSVAQIKLQESEKLEHDGADLLNQLPAFNSIRKSGNYGFDPVFRGFKYDQLNIVLNGAQSASAACPNRMDPPSSQMAPNMIQKIEVFKGPYALRYGTAFGATINFVQTPLFFTDIPIISGRFSSSYESNGAIRRGEAKVGYSNRIVDLSVFGSWSMGDDYKNAAGVKTPSDFSRASFGANIGFKLSELQKMRLSTTYNKARDVDFAALMMDLRKDDTWLMNLQHEYSPKNSTLRSWKTTIFASFVDHLMDNKLKPLNPRMLNASTDAQTHNYGARTEGEWLVANNHLFSGFDFRVEGAEGIRERNFIMGPNNGKSFYDNAWQDGEIQKAAWFAEFKKHTTALDYVVSTRLEWNHAEIQDVATEFSNINQDDAVNQFNIAFSLGFVKELNDKFSSSLWLGRVQRSGSLTERFINYFTVGQDPYEMLGNPNLKAEVNHQIDLSFDWRPTQLASFKLDLFAAYLTNYISSTIQPGLSTRLPNSPGVRQYTNLDEVYKTGFEIQWAQALSKHLQHNLSLAYTYAQNVDLDEALAEIAPLDFRYTLIGHFYQSKLHPEVVFRYVARQTRISQAFGETETPSFKLVDLNLKYNVSSKWSVQASVQNLFDELYYEHLNRMNRTAAQAIYAPGRNISASLNIQF